MQNPESITVDLETAKALKEAGWPQDEACFYWIHAANDKFTLTDFNNAHDDHNGNCDSWMKHPKTCAAPTAEEILRELPVCFIRGNTKRIVRMVKDSKDGRYSVFHESYAIKIGDGELPFYDVPEIIKFDSLANAAAAMWIYLKNNGLLPEK